MQLRGRDRIARLGNLLLAAILLSPFLILYSASTIQADDIQAGRAAAASANARIAASVAAYRDLNCDSPDELTSHPGLPARCEVLFLESDQVAKEVPECALYGAQSNRVMGLITGPGFTALLTGTAAACAVWGALWWLSVKMSHEEHEFRKWRGQEGDPEERPSAGTYADPLSTAEEVQVALVDEASSFPDYHVTFDRQKSD